MKVAARSGARLKATLAPDSLGFTSFDSRAQTSWLLSHVAAP